MYCIEVNHLSETEALGNTLGNLVEKGDVISLTGDLGAGKTTFTQAFAKALEIQEAVTSPTFTIVNEYIGRLPMFHFDVYRIEDPATIEDIGFDEYIFGEGVSIIEWGNIIKDMLPPNSVWINIEVRGPQQRRICIEGEGQLYKRLMKELDGK